MSKRFHRTGEPFDVIGLATPKMTDPIPPGSVLFDGRSIEVVIQRRSGEAAYSDVTGTDIAMAAMATGAVIDQHHGNPNYDGGLK